MSIPYIIKSFRGGVSDESDKGVAGAFKHGYGLDIHGRDDVLRCASTFATIDESTINQSINFFVNAKDGTTYAFGAQGSVYAIAGDPRDPVVSFAYNDENGGIKGAAEWQLSDGNNYLVWATNTSLARVLLNSAKDIPWSGATQDYKTTLDGAEWHTMDIASGNLNIANGNFLATIDYSGNFNPAALNVRPGNLIKAIEELDDYSILGSTRVDNAGEGHAWSWTPVAKNYVQKKRIPEQGVNAIIQTESLLAQAGSNGELYQLSFDGLDPIPLIGITGGGKTNPGGVSIENGLAAFGMFGGSYPGIWTYGRKRSTHPQALNYQYRLAKTIAGSAISTISAVTNVGGLLMASWGTTDGSTSDYGVDMVSSTTYASANYEGLEFDADEPHTKKIFNTVKLVMTPLPSGATVAVKYKNNWESAWRYAVLGTGATTFSEADQVEAIFSIDAPAMTYEVGTEITPGTDTPNVVAIVNYLSEETHDY